VGPEILVNDQLDAQFFFTYTLISILYMFRATSSSSSGESIVSIRLVYATVCKRPSGMQVGKVLPDLRTRRCMDTIDSPDDEHEVAGNM
jgi:hypothetical protein